MNKALDKVIAGYSEKFSGRLKVHRLESHGGTAKCANTGLALCKNEYIMKMDSDDICLEDRAVKQMTYLANHPEVSILGSYIQEFDSNTGEDIAIRNRLPRMIKSESLQNAVHLSTIRRLYIKSRLRCR